MRQGTSVPQQIGADGSLKFPTNAAGGSPTKKLMGVSQNLLQLDLNVHPRSTSSADLELLLYFGVHRKELAKYPIGLRPYVVSWAVTGGVLLVDLAGLHAPLGGRLGESRVAEVVAMKRIVSNEAADKHSKSHEDTVEGKFEVSPALVGKRTAKSDHAREQKTTSTGEFPSVHANLITSGPDHAPEWTFQTFKRVEALLGWSPGRCDKPDSAPLAKLIVSDTQVEVHGAFYITADDVVVLDVRSNRFSEVAPVCKKVARHALVEFLRKKLKDHDGYKCLGMVSMAQCL